MKLKLKSKVDAEGKLFLQLPPEFANQELDIIIDYAQETIPTPEGLGYPADFFDKTAGKWQGKPWDRENLVDCDRRVWDVEA